jgi:hypothetical protein
VTLTRTLPALTRTRARNLIPTRTRTHTRTRTRTFTLALALALTLTHPHPHPHPHPHQATLDDFAGALEQYKRSRAPAQPYGAGGDGAAGATAGDFLSAWLQQAMRVSEGGGGGRSAAAHGIEDNE